MGDDEEARLTLSPEDLYELAWSKPISKLAKDFGISDVGLAKWCRCLGVPRSRLLGADRCGPKALPSKAAAPLV